MFTSIVVPTDLEAGGDRALPIAGSLALQAGIPVELVTVSSPSMSEEVDIFELRWRAVSTGAACTSTVLHDNDAAEAIAAFVAERPDALVVMATRARSPLGQHLLGSVSEAVLGRSSHPVLLVGPRVLIDEPSASVTLVAGVDGTPTSEAILPAVTGWLDSFGGPPPWLLEVRPAADERPAVGDVDQSSSAQRLASRLQEQGIDAEWEIAHARHAADALIEFADRVVDAVLVVASSRWTDPKHTHLTSVARKLAQHAHHPVLVVPRRTAC
jgi:nucleotide-binding universal stress UspA family protein